MPDLRACAPCLIICPVEIWQGELRDGTLCIATRPLKSLSLALKDGKRDPDVALWL